MPQRGSMEEATPPEAPRQPSPWERFTPQLQRAISRAQRRATAAGLREVQPEHLLEGLLAGVDTIPPWVVASLGVDLEPLRRGMAALPPMDHPAPEMRLAPSTLDVLALAEWEARQLHDPGVGTSHALLALLNVESPAAECLWRWRMTREYLFEWLVERSREERLDTEAVEWKLELLPAALTAAAAAHVDGNAAFVRDALPQWLGLRALWGLVQCLVIIVGFSATIGTDMARISPHGYWLLLWAVEGAWTSFACCYLPRGLAQFEHRTWSRLFAFMYVQCAVLTVALLGMPREGSDLGGPGLVLVLLFSVITAAVHTTALFKSRQVFGVKPREGWRTTYREAGWVLLVSGLMGAAGLLSWHLRGP